MPLREDGLPQRPNQIFKMTKLTNSFELDIIAYWRNNNCCSTIKVSALLEGDYLSGKTYFINTIAHKFSHEHVSHKGKSI